MTRTLAAAGFAGRAADLRRPHLTAFWMGTTADRESCTRRALAAFARDGGTLHPAVAELAAGRNFNPVFNHSRCRPTARPNGNVSPRRARLSPDLPAAA